MVIVTLVLKQEIRRVPPPSCTAKLGISRLSERSERRNFGYRCSLTARFSFSSSPPVERSKTV